MVLLLWNHKMDLFEKVIQRYKDAQCYFVDQRISDLLDKHGIKCGKDVTYNLFSKKFTANRDKQIIMFYPVRRTETEFDRQKTDDYSRMYKANATSFSIEPIGSKVKLVGIYSGTILSADPHLPGENISNPVYFDTTDPFTGTKN